MTSSTVQPESKFVNHDNTLVRYVEVWTPGDDGSRLVLESARSVGIKGRQIDQDVTSVAIGEGLVGEAWEQKVALICHDKSKSSLLDSDQVDLECVVVIPVFCLQKIRGAVVLGLGNGFGAAEIWSRDDRDELSVTSGHYSGLPSFEFITGYTRFPKGAGLPGNVWKTGLPVVATSLDKSSAFIRSFGNDPAVVTSAIGLPISSSRGFPASVLLLLEAADCPLAVCTELWACTTKQSQDSESTEIETCTAVGADNGEICSWKNNLMAQIAASKSPVATQSENDGLPEGAPCVVAMPIFHNSELTAVLALTF